MDNIDNKISAKFPWQAMENKKTKLRSFDASGIKTEDIKADYKNGVLILELPKKGDSPGGRKIDIG